MKKRKLLARVEGIQNQKHNGFHNPFLDRLDRNLQGEPNLLYLN